MIYNIKDNNIDNIIDEQIPIDKKILWIKERSLAMQAGTFVL